MNHGVRIFMKAVPLVMALFCLFYGLYVFYNSDDSSARIAAPVVCFTGLICLSFFTLVDTVLRQITNAYNKTGIYITAALSYIGALGTLIFGIILFSGTDNTGYFVAGHIISGLGLIALCVSTATVVATRFSLIVVNRLNTGKKETNPHAFSSNVGLIFMAIVTFFSIITWSWSLIMLSNSHYTSYFVAGSVMGGIACVCTSFIPLVAVILRQQQNVYSDREKRVWPWIAIGAGIFAVAWGIIEIIFYYGQTRDFVGFILIGFGLLCFAVACVVSVMTRIWAGDYKMASRIRIFPVLIALGLLFFSAVLFEEAMADSKFMVSARISVGVGALCFVLFSAANIIYTGTKKTSAGINQ